MTTDLKTDVGEPNWLGQIASVSSTLEFLIGTMEQSGARSSATATLTKALHLIERAREQEELDRDVRRIAASPLECSEEEFLRKLDELSRIGHDTTLKPWHGGTKLKALLLMRRLAARFPGAEPSQDGEHP